MGSSSMARQNLDDLAAFIAVARDRSFTGAAAKLVLDAAVKAGAKFGVSPGVTPTLAEACEDADLPLLGGIATVTEAMTMLERGYEVCKFFPAEANGGAKALKSFAGPLPQVSFCPTGGVIPENAVTYLSLPNTGCVGGSWVAPNDLVAAGDWAGITALAAEAAKLKVA